jgi:hypothetical protein
LPFGSVTLQPGLDVEKTPLLLRAGFTASQLIRFRDSLAQKFGGWTKFFPFAVGGIPRDLHAWQDLDNIKYLSVATTSQLAVIFNNSLSDISPQVLTSNFSPTNITLNPVVSLVANAPTTTSSSTSSVAAVPADVVSGLLVFDATNSSAIGTVLSTTLTSITLTANASHAIASGDTLNFISPSTTINITDPNIANVTVEDAILFNTPVSIGGLVLSGLFQITQITGTSSYQIQAASAATTAAPAVVLEFTTTLNSSTILVTFTNHQQVVGNMINFVIPTVQNGVTIFGATTY